MVLAAAPGATSAGTCASRSCRSSRRRPSRCWPRRACPRGSPAAWARSIVVLESVQQLFQFHSNWTHYRSTSEALKHEKFLYLAHAGSYATAANPEALLAERIEARVSQEHASWASEQNQAQHQK